MKMNIPPSAMERSSELRPVVLMPALNAFWKMRAAALLLSVDIEMISFIA
jgi:hypothetical protein